VTPGAFYLVRHAEAEKSGGVADAARRLTPGGRARFAAHAAALAPGLRLTRVLSSPLARARETAELLAAAAGVPVEILEALAPGLSTGRQILELARRSGAGAAFVGHNPEMAEAIRGAGGGGEGVPPGTVAAIEPGDAGYRLLWMRAP
jgi:phosphohistidine phosphatase